MVLINRPDEPHTYCYRGWRTASCPDISIATDVATITERHVELQLGGSDHKPVLLVIKEDLRQAGRKLCPSWNYKKQTGQNFVKKQMKTAEPWRWSNITWMNNWTYPQEPSSALQTKQFLEEGGETTSQAGMHSCWNSLVLSAYLERRWDPARQMITQMPTTKPKQNLSDKSPSRHALHGMKKTVLPQHGKRFVQVVEAYWAANWRQSRKRHRRFCSQRESLLLKRKQPTAWQSCTKREQW